MLRTTNANAAHLAFEQSNADLTLLSQSLAKARRVTDKMTTRLSDFDDRLARLDKSLLPIHKQTGKLTKVSKNLEATLRSIDGLLGHHDLVDREAPVITKGPNANDLKPYMASIDRLVAASEVLRRTDAKGQSMTLAQMGILIEQGAKQLVGVFAKWAKETSTPVDAGMLFDSGKAFPSLSTSFLDNALPMFAYLRALPIIGAAIAKDVEFAYADVRASFMEECLKNSAKEVLVDAAAAGNQPAAEKRGLGRLLDVMLAMAKYEHALLATVFSQSPVQTRRDIYAAILPPALGTIYTTGQQLNTLIKKSLQALVSVAFASFSDLQERVSEFDDWVRTRAGRKDNEIGELLHAFRGSCLRSLPEFIDDTKSWGARPLTNAESNNVSVNQMTMDVVSFMKQLTDSQATVETFLNVLGPGNWGGPPNRPPIKDDEGASLLTRYLNDVLTTLVNSLESRGKAMRARAGLAAIFLLNNLSYVRREVLSSQVGDILGETCEDQLNKKMRSAKAAYLDIWSPLVSALLDAGPDQSGAAGAIKAGIGAVKGGGEKRETKDRFVRFFDAFEDVEALHQVATLDSNEVELRERLRGEVERMIVPTYAKFLARHRNGEFSKNPSKYFKLDAEGLTARMGALFE